ncbi:MAG TPA: TlpA disulfide reductase family protein [Thermoanaerobaculia bacterium]
MTARSILLIALATLSVAACRKERPVPENLSAPGAARTKAPQASAAAPGAATVGAPMPPYKAKTLDGAEFDLASLKGNVVLVNIWATWCGPCRQEIPELITLHDTYASRGFQVLGASVDGAESAKQVAPMVEDRKINSPVILDTEGKIADIFETSVIPTSVLIDREGRVVWTRVGPLEADETEVVEAIEKALGR